MLIRTLILLLSSLEATLATPSPSENQYPLSEQDDGPRNSGVSIGFFADLERLSRLVDITYCVGTTGIYEPFTCASRCKDFPTLKLITTWNTGALLTDSCGYIAVDHGTSSNPNTNASEDTDGHFSPAAIIVAFRGTYSITNTIIDLSTVPQEYVPYPPPDDGDDGPPGEPLHKCDNCTVHMGFLTSWKVARKVVLLALKPLHERYPGYPIYIVGHSLGGAVAALAALELKVIRGWDDLVVTTFGEPRIGNGGFVKYLDMVFKLNDTAVPAEQRTYRRLTHADDPVPLLPLSEWGYRSHAGELFIPKADLPPEASDIRSCIGDYDPHCIAGSAGEDLKVASQAPVEAHPKRGAGIVSPGLWDVPARYKLWELFFAHRDYFWRLGLCVPGGDPIDWDRNGDSNIVSNDEL